MPRVIHVRGFWRIALAAVALGWLGVGSPAIRVDPDSMRTRITVVDWVPDAFLAEARRPIFSLHIRLNDSQPGLWPTQPPDLAIHAPAFLGSGSFHPLTLEAGWVAQGLSGRGPPPLA